LQNHKDFEIIIVNDSPLVDYLDVEKYIENLSDTRIKYFKNETNRGVNFTRNFALTKISTDSHYTIFLDDDDWLHPDALTQINNILENKKTEKSDIDWLVTNRSVGVDSLTENKTGRDNLNYFCDYLILKRFTGDCTHTIKSNISKRYEFSKLVKNGEEWTYFIQLPLSIYYKDINTTNSAGYAPFGLNAGMQKSYRANTRLLWGEVKNCKMFFMLSLRELRSLFRKN
jgi:glycosyltransferase involved in cell wall biosynthesis